MTHISTEHYQEIMDPIQIIYLHITVLIFSMLLGDRHAHYELGLTPLVLVWKDVHCCQYLLDTDSQGNVPAYQQV